MNKGLNRKSTYFEKPVGSSGTFITNLNKNEGGLYIKMSGFTTPGLSPFTFSLNFSSFNFFRTDAYGDAVRESYYCNLSHNTSKNIIYYTDSLNYTKAYTLDTPNVYKCAEDNTTITRVAEANTSNVFYYLRDKHENELKLQLNKSVPLEIKLKSGETYTFSSRTHISNNKGITIEILNNFRIISFKKDGNEIYNMELVVENNWLSKIIHKKPIITDGVVTYETLYTNEYIFDTKNKKITIIDGHSNYKVEFRYTETNGTYLLNSYIESYKDTFDEEHINRISYNENYTRVESYLGENVDYYFNSNGTLKKKINSLGQIELYEYDENDYLKTKVSNLNHTDTYGSKYGIISVYFKDGNPLSYTVMYPTINRFSDFLYIDKVGDKALTISNYSNSSTFYIEKNYNGKKDEYLTLSLWSINNSVASVSSLNIKLELINHSTVVETHEFSIDNENWEIDAFQIKTENSYTKIKLTFSPTDGGSYHINAINLIPSATHTYYLYDEKGNLLSSNYMDNSSEVIYSDNKQIQKYSEYNKLSRYKYNDKNQVIEETASNGTIKRYEYNQDNQLINEKIAFNNKYISSSNTYENGYIKTSTSDINSSATYNINHLTGISNSITNGLGEVESYTYNSRDDIEELMVSKNNENKKIEYIYKTYKKVPVIDKIKLENGSTYEYIYDEYERVIGIDYYNINSVTDKKRLITYTYEDKKELQNNNIKSVSKFNNIYTKHYEYDNYNNITGIYYSAYMTGGPIVTYTYDENKRLIKEVKGFNNYTKNYLYDSLGRLKETNDTEGITFNYQYDNKNQLRVKKQKIDNENIYYEYDTLSATRGSDSQAVIAEYETRDNTYACFYNYFDDNMNRKIELVNFSSNGDITIKQPLANSLNVVTENGLSKIDYTRASGEKLKFTLDIENELNYCHSIGFWFYPVRDLKKQTLIYTELDGSQKNKVEVRYEETLLNGEWTGVVSAILYIDDYPKQKHILLSHLLEKEKWHFIFLNLYSYSDLGIEAEEFSFELYVDGLYDYSGFYSGVTVKQRQNQELIIGGGTDINDKLVGYIGPIIYSNEMYIVKDDIDKYYLLTKEYILNNSYLLDEVKYFNTATLNRYDFINTKEVYPLNSSLNSLNGKEPYSYTSKLGMKYDSSSAYKYNREINKHAFVADGSILKYKLDGGFSGSIRFKFLIEEKSDRQYILDFLSGNNERIAIYRGKDNQLYLNHKSYSKQTQEDISLGIVIDNDIWYSFGIDYQSHTSNTSKVNIYINDTIVTNTDTKTLVGGGIITLGLSDGVVELPIENSEETYESYCPLYGLIEQLSFGSTSFTNNQYKYENDYSVKSYSNHYNEFGLKVKEVNRCNEKNELVKEYSYKSSIDESSKIKIIPLVNFETYIYKKAIDLFNYNYDNLGRIISINGNGKYITYEYNYDGSLNKESHYIGDEDLPTPEIAFRYEYDNNFNITKIYQINKVGAETVLYSYNYDTIYPDRVASINWNTFRYDSVNHLYPTAFGVFDSNGNQTSGFTYSWDDTLLTSVTINGSTYHYTYDKATKLKKTKTVNGVVTNFYYDDNNLLIKEVSPTIEKEYIYDMNGSIKELIITKDNIKYRYIYLKDILGNVIGLLDENLNKVASYEYYAYGRIKSQSTTVTTPFRLNEENPFRYRGYYYDNSIHMYYCQTRYYLPEYGRWLSPDDVDYLDPTSINGMNLYCYCENDPVNYSDGSGHSPEWVQGLAIGLAIVGAVLVVGAITALTMGVGTTIMATTMTGAVIHGAAVGTLIGAGVGVVAGGIIGGAVSDWSAEGILTGMGIGFGGGAVLGAVIGGSVGALQYTSAANSWLGGKEKMISHFNKHGVDMGYKNVIQYTKGAKNVIKNGTYLAQKNAYYSLYESGKYLFTGVGQGSNLITTFGIRSFTKTAAIALGLL